jgi:hypothetical protein
VHLVCGDPACPELSDDVQCAIYAARFDRSAQSAIEAANPVSAAARAALAVMKSDHAGAPLLQAIVVKLCEDIDGADRVLDRIAATRQVVALLNVLDGALFAGGGLPGVVDGPGDDGVPEPDGDDPDDVFQIGDVPPGVGDETP